MPLTRAQAASEVMWHLVTHEAHGYSQPARYGGGGTETIYLSDGEEVTIATDDRDCSSGVIESYESVGVDCGGATYTGNMRRCLLGSGNFEEINPWDAQDGDILLTDGHTELCIDMDGQWIQAGFRHSEDYDIHGEPGDQTGDESSWSWFDESEWETAFRYVGPEREDEPAPSGKSEEEIRREKEIREMQPVSNEGGDVYRLYNPYGGEHHFTTSAGERDALVGAGWKYEGVAWTARVGRYAVYRLYNPHSGDHLFTTSFDEAKACADAGWTYEGVPFMAVDDGVKVFRLYNPYGGEHMYTSSRSECDSLQAVGWRLEGSFDV